MKIEVLYLHGCPNHPRAMATLRQALSGEDVLGDIAQIEITDSAMAERTGFLGSPSIRVNGKDVEPAVRTSGTFGLACRVYAGPSGPQGSPPLGVIQKALREAARSHP